jgi:phytoene synthase
VVRSRPLDEHGRAGNAEDMADLAAELPQPQRLALSCAPAGVRPATAALLALDARLAAILRQRREPIAAQLRLAWWRETLAKPPADWPRGEPVLDALRGWHDASGLAALAEGWEALLAEQLTSATVAEFAAGRGQAFACLARELGVAATGNVERAARIWALADLAAHLSDDAERALVVAEGRALTPPKLPRPLRPLAVLAGLGARALRLGGEPLLGGPGAMLLALRIGLTGR